jgi:hypothetical protein
MQIRASRFFLFSVVFNPKTSMEQIPEKDLKDIMNQLEGQHKDV